MDYPPKELDEELAALINEHRLDLDQYMVQMSGPLLTPDGEGHAGFRERCQRAVDRAGPPGGIRRGGRSDAAWSGGGAACAGQAGP